MKPVLFIPFIFSTISVVNVVKTDHHQWQTRIEYDTGGFWIGIKQGMKPSMYFCFNA